jgi:methylmalonyl-CoA mutase cobalamin-binding domain/chain
MGETLAELRQAVLEGEDIIAETLAKQAVAEGIPASEILDKSVMGGIQDAAVLWQKNEYFLPDMVMSAEAFRQAMTVVEPLISNREQQYAGRYLIGTVAGDMHDLGKMIVVAMLRGAGFEVIDLGEDVPRQTFLDKATELQPDILGLGCYMTTTMAEVTEIVREIKSGNLSDKVSVMVGGVPTSQDFADQIGADAWGKDAIDTVNKCRALLETK